MKEFLTNIIVILYFIFSMGILMLAIIYPFMIDMKDNPEWLKWYFIYPLALIICASQNQCLRLIEKYKNI